MTSDKIATINELYEQLSFAEKIRLMLAGLISKHSNDGSVEQALQAFQAEAALDNNLWLKYFGVAGSSTKKSLSMKDVVASPDFAEVWGGLGSLPQT